MKNKSGFGLIEVMAAAVVLGFLIIGLNILANLLSLLITGALTTVLWLVFNPLAALIFALPLVMYNGAIVEFVSVEYFRIQCVETKADCPRKQQENNSKTVE